MTGTDETNKIDETSETLETNKTIKRVEPRRRLYIAAAVGVLMLLVAVAVTATVLRSGSLTMSGMITVVGNGGSGGDLGIGDPCPGRAAPDVTNGTTVTVYSDSGHIVGQGVLSDGRTVANPLGASANDCTYTLTVADLPSVSYYQVEIASRGRVTVNKSDMHSVALSLGG
jgi:hypothetical protein